MNREEASRKWYSVRKEDFKLTCDSMSDVMRQHKHVPFIIYAVYRLVFALYFFAFLIFFEVSSAKEFGFGVKVLLYVTDWTNIVVTVYLIVACANSFGDCCMTAGKGVVRYQVQWFLFNISATASVIITIVYWTAIRPFMSDDDNIPIYQAVTFHVIPVIIYIIDILLTTVIVRFVHFIYPLVYLIIYLIFGLIYSAAGGTDPYGYSSIYPGLDFENNPGYAVGWVVGAFGATLLAQAILKGVYAFRHQCIDERQQTGTVYQTNRVV